MKKILFIISALLMCAHTFAQNGGGGGTRNRGGGQAAAAALPPLPFREVSGVVRDSSDNAIIGATVTLKSKKDTIRTSTNADGIFVLKNVKLAAFSIEVASMGYVTKFNKYLQNDAVKKLVLDPIIMRENSKQLKTVTINGVPSITYKTDTVEYRASDYKVRENSTVDELLKKMEGFEVGSDGSVTHQGQAITKAKLNGKTYASGDVAAAIQNLPADIVEKIQVVDDYGDAAARTGVKDGDPQKVLNITTRADRSVGTTGRLTGQYGNNDRYNANLFVQRINANQQLGLIGNLRNTVNGVASSGVSGGATNGGGGGSVGAGARGGGSPGTTKSGGPSINYRDQWSKKVQVTGGYAYTFNNNNSINSSYGQSVSTYGSSDFVSHSTREADSKNHNFNFEMDITPDSANYIQITPTFIYSSSTSASNSFSDNINRYTTGFEHPVVNGVSSSLNSAPDYSGTVFYQHIFKKPKRNISVQLSLTNSNSIVNSDKFNDYHYYGDSTENISIKDELSHLLTYRTSDNTTYRASMTYVEPLGKYSQFEFNGQTRKSQYDNKAITDTVLASGQLLELTRFNNVYNYSFIETRLTFNYRFTGVKYNISLGTTLVPTQLDGTKVNQGAGADVSTSRSDFRIIPVFRFAYAWSRTERFTFAYSGSNQEPGFQQIQPFVDKSDTNNVVIGNPNLRASFSNSLTAQYNNYIANSKLNFSVGLNGTYTQDQISSNVILQRVLLTPAVPASGSTPAKPATYKNIRNTYYVNLDDTHAIVGRYNVAKQLDDRKYNLSLNGNVTYSYSTAMSNNVLYHNTNWRFDERFGPRISPNENIEINPYIGYDISRSFTTLLNATSTSLQTTSLAIDGKVYFLKTFQVNYSATKSYVTGLSGLNTNPLVINMGLQKEFLKRKNLVITFDIYDLLHQNNFIEQTLPPQGGYTNTLSNSLSRYFLIGMRLNLQKWSGTPTRNGRQMMRRGDGSFVY
jgi:hypothetical protein